jgi:hypothetical protein
MKTKVTLSEQELRSLIKAALIQEAPEAPGTTTALTSSSYIKDAVASASDFNPAKRLALIKYLTGIDADAWWKTVKNLCTIAQAQYVTSGGVVWSSNANTVYETNPKEFLDGFLNYCTLGVLSFKTVTLRSTRSGTGPDSSLTLTPKHAFDVIMSEDGNTAYVKDNALATQCNALLGVGSSILIDQSGDDLLKDEIIDKLLVTKQAHVSGETPSDMPKNLCYTYVPESVKKRIKTEFEQAWAARRDRIEKVLDDTNREVYETFLYMPLLNPRIWLQPDHPPDSPLFTPWRMTWSACYLLSDILVKHGDDGKYAIMTQLYRIMSRGTSLNIADAPGADYALAGGLNVSNIEESRMARLVVNSVMLTEADLRRVIAAALSEGIFGRSAARAGIDIASDVAGAGARMVGRAADAAAAEGEALDAAGRSITEFGTLLSKGDIIAASKFDIPEIFENGIDNLKLMLGQRIARDMPDQLPAIDEAVVLANLRSPKGATVSSDGATKIVECFNKLTEIAVAKAKGIDTATLEKQFDDLAATISDQDRVILASTSEPLSKRSSSPQTATTEVVRTSGKGIREESAKWLENQGAAITSDWDLKASVDPSTNKIVVSIRRPNVTYDSSTKTFTITISSTDRISIDEAKRDVAKQASALVSRIPRDARYAGVDLEDYVLEPIIATRNKLNDDILLKQIVADVTNSVYSAVDEAASKAIPNGTTAGLFDTAGTSKIGDKIFTFFDYLATSNPRKGLLPFVQTGLTDVKGHKIQAGSLSKSAWENLKPNLAPGATSGQKAKAYVQNLLRFIATFGAATYELYGTITKLKALAGQRSVSAIGKGLTKIPNVAAKGLGSKMISWVEGEKLGHYVGLGAFHAASYGLALALTKITGETSEKEVSEPFAWRMIKTLYKDINTGIISFNNKGVTLFAGGIPRVLLDIIIQSYSSANSTDVKDFDSMSAALSSTGTPDTSAVNEILVNAFRNLYTSAILASDPVTQVFPGLQGTFANVFPELNDIVEEAKTTAAAAMAGTQAVAEQIGQGSRPGSALAAGTQAATAMKQASARLQQSIDMYKSAVQSLSDGTDVQLNLDSARVSIIEDAVVALTSPDSAEAGAVLKSSAISTKVILVEDDLGRGDAQEAEVSETLDVAAKILYDNQSYFEFATTYLEYSGDPATGVAIAASRGKFGQEFLGKLNDSDAKQALAVLAKGWEESAGTLAKALSVVTRQDAEQ